MDLPDGRGQTLDSALVVTLEADNTVGFQGIRGPMPEVVGRIAAAAGEDALVIRGDRQADLGVAVELLDLLRREGVQRVSFQVEAER